MIRGPYKNSKLLSGIKIDRIVDRLVEVSRDREYDILSPENYVMQFITGKDVKEKEIPFWDHPIITEGVKLNESIVYVDLRRYVNLNKDSVFLEDIASDKSGTAFQIKRALLSTLTDDKRFGELKQIQNSIAGLFSYLMSYLINQGLTLEPSEQLRLEIIAAAYVHSMFIPDMGNGEAESILIARCSNTKYTIPVLGNQLILSLIREVGIENLRTQTFSGLIDNFKKVLPSKEKFINVDMFINASTGLWYGPGGISTILCAYEDLATLVTLAYVSITDRNYRKTRIAQIADKNKRKMDIKEIENLKKFFSNYTSM